MLAHTVTHKTINKSILRSVGGFSHSAKKRLFALDSDDLSVLINNIVHVAVLMTNTLSPPV